MKLPPLLCPGSHTLPHTGDRGSCTPLRCGDTGAVGTTKILAEPPPKPQRPGRPKTGGLINQRRAQAVAKLTADLMLPSGGDESAAMVARDETLAGESPNVGKAAARRAFVAGDAPPSTADDVTINNWADRRATVNLIDAILEKEWQLKYGTPDQRNRAADTFLRMTGRDQKDQPVSTQATIVLNMGGVQLPFAPRQVIDVQPSQPILPSGGEKK